MGQHGGGRGSRNSCRPVDQLLMVASPGLGPTARGIYELFGKDSAESLLSVCVRVYECVCLYVCACVCVCIRFCMRSDDVIKLF